MTPLGGAWFSFCRSIAKLILFDFSGGMTYIGTENIPKTGRLIVAPVHVSYLDSIAVSFAIGRPIQPMAKKELFKGLMGWFVKSLGAFPVEREGAGPETIKTALTILEREEVVLIFPEGTRSDGKKMLPVNRGVGLIAKKTNSLILPIGIAGTLERWPIGAKRILRGRVTVAYGKPFRYEDVATGKSEKENRELFARALAERIAEQCQVAGMNIKISPSNSRSQEPLAPEPKA